MLRAAYCRVGLLDEPAEHFDYINMAPCNSNTLCAVLRRSAAETNLWRSYYTSHKNTNLMHKFFDYGGLKVVYIPLQDDLPTTSIMYGYYFIWQPLVVTLHHMQYNK